MTHFSDGYSQRAERDRQRRRAGRAAAYAVRAAVHSGTVLRGDSSPPPAPWVPRVPEQREPVD